MGKRVFSALGVLVWTLMFAAVEAGASHTYAHEPVDSSLWFWGKVGLFVVFGLITLFSMAFTVEQQTNVPIERFGKFARIAKPGLNFKIPYIEKRAGGVNLRIRELSLSIESKTADDVFVVSEIAIQYFVEPGKVYDAYYLLEDHEEQMKSYVYDTVRAKVPSLKIDDVFAKKEEIAEAVETNLNTVMSDYGYRIKATLVNDIKPDQKVKDSMNEVNAQERLRKAAEHKGEAEKTLKVKAAEADAQSKKLQGEGIANQRKAIVAGLREAVANFQEGVPETSASEVMRTVMMTQYFDTLKEIGANSRTNTLLLTHSPGGLANLDAQLQEAMLSTSLVGKKEKEEGHFDGAVTLGKKEKKEHSGGATA